MKKVTIQNIASDIINGDIMNKFVCLDFTLAPGASQKQRL